MNSSFANQEIYYCSTEKIIGIAPSEKFETVNIKDFKFKAKVDYMNLKVFSKELLYDGLPPVCTKYDDELYCINKSGWSFSINKSSKRFTLSTIMNSSAFNDDIVVGYGYCETF